MVATRDKRTDAVEAATVLLLARHAGHTRACLERVRELAAAAERAEQHLAALLAAWDTRVVAGERWLARSPERR